MWTNNEAQSIQTLSTYYLSTRLWPRNSHGDGVEESELQPDHTHITPVSPHPQHSYTAQDISEPGHPSPPWTEQLQCICIRPDAEESSQALIKKIYAMKCKPTTNRKKKA